MKTGDLQAPSVSSVRWIELPSHRDARGVLTAVEAEHDIPFAIQRVFWMHHVVQDRGGHAHLDTDQVIIGCSGRFRVDISSPTETLHFVFDDPTRGLFVPRLLFTRLYDFTPEAVCLALASTHYDMSRSIRTWDDYLARVGAL